MDSHLRGVKQNNNTICILVMTAFEHGGKALALLMMPTDFTATPPLFSLALFVYWKYQMEGRDYPELMLTLLIE